MNRIRRFNNGNANFYMVVMFLRPGSIVESENDQPYSKEWSNRGLRDLDDKGR